MRRAVTATVGVCTAVTLALGMAPSAYAVNYDDDNLHSGEVCRDKSRSNFKFHIHYNSGQNGSYRNIGYSVYNFDALRPGGSDPGTYPLRYCSFGASNPWPGSGQRIKNNAASGSNDHYKYMARVYYNSGYKGPQDAMAPYQHIDRFRNVYNQNASFKWTS